LEDAKTSRFRDTYESLLSFVRRALLVSLSERRSGSFCLGIGLFLRDTALFVLRISFPGQFDEEVVRGTIDIHYDSRGKKIRVFTGGMPKNFSGLLIEYFGS
jgi:hypothetical protein